MSDVERKVCAHTLEAGGEDGGCGECYGGVIADLASARSEVAELKHSLEIRDEQLTVARAANREARSEAEARTKENGARLLARSVAQTEHAKLVLRASVAEAERARLGPVPDGCRVLAYPLREAVERSLACAKDGPATCSSSWCGQEDDHAGECDCALIDWWGERDALRAALSAVSALAPDPRGAEERARGMEEAAEILIGCWDDGDQGPPRSEIEQYAEIVLLRSRARALRASVSGARRPGPRVPHSHARALRDACAALLGWITLCDRQSVVPNKDAALANEARERVESYDRDCPGYEIPAPPSAPGVAAGREARRPCTRCRGVPHYEDNCPAPRSEDGKEKPCTINSWCTEFAGHYGPCSDPEDKKGPT